MKLFTVNRSLPGCTVHENQLRLWQTHERLYRQLSDQYLGRPEWTPAARAEVFGDVYDAGTHADQQPGDVIWDGDYFRLYTGVSAAEQFNIAGKVRGYISCRAEAIDDALIHFGINPFTYRREAADEVHLLTEWMKRNAPTNPLWSPICGSRSLAFCKRLGLQIHRFESIHVASWQRQKSNGFA